MTVTYNAADPSYNYSLFSGDIIAHSHDISTNEVVRLAALDKGKESTRTEIKDTIAKVTNCSDHLAKTVRGSPRSNNYFVDHHIRLDEGLITNLNNILYQALSGL